jgi:kynurenine 3-monooxygenase
MNPLNRLAINLSVMKQQKIAIIGAGPAGLLMSIYLAKRGFDIVIYERLSESELILYQQKRSINLTLSRRGLEAFSEIQLLEEVIKKTVRLNSRAIHRLNGTVSFQAYGKSKDECLYAIRRDALQSVLLGHIMNLGNVKLYFNNECSRIDKDKAIVYLRDRYTNEEFSEQFDLIIGADGAFSKIRQQIQYKERANFQQEFLDWGYKELIIPSDLNGAHQMERNALHVWAHDQVLLIGIPNPNGSFSCTCILPFEGKYSLSSLKDKDVVYNFFNQFFPDILKIAPEFPSSFLDNPTGHFVTIKTFPWHYRNLIVLIGDASHAVVPFYGQGLNAACEDCSLLDKLIDEFHGDWENIFLKYQSIRKKDTDVLAYLSIQNFIELRDKSISLRLHKAIDLLLNRLFPNVWLPLYTMISHTKTPYAEALRHSKVQQLIFKILVILILVIIGGGFLGYS